MKNFSSERKRRGASGLLLGDCQRRSYHQSVRIKEFHLLQPNDEENLKIALYVLGPISVSIRATKKFFFYKAWRQFLK